MTAYDDWKTTEPRDLDREWADAQDEADELAAAAFDEASDLASLFRSVGLDADAPDPFTVAASVKGRSLTAARRRGL